MEKSTILQLNVSGSTDGFAVPRSLFLKNEGSALEAMFSDRNMEML